MDSGVVGVRIGTQAKIIVSRAHALELESAINENLISFANLSGTRHYNGKSHH